MQASYGIVGLVLSKVIPMVLASGTLVSLCIFDLRCIIPSIVLVLYTYDLL